jgi:hypothetical protein
LLYVSRLAKLGWTARTELHQGITAAYRGFWMVVGGDVGLERLFSRRGQTPKPPIHVINDVGAVGVGFPPKWSGAIGHFLSAAKAWGMDAPAENMVALGRD